MLQHGVHPYFTPLWVCSGVGGDDSDDEEEADSNNDGGSMLSERTDKDEETCEGKPAQALSAHPELTY